MASNIIRIWNYVETLKAASNAMIENYDNLEYDFTCNYKVDDSGKLYKAIHNNKYSTS